MQLYVSGQKNIKTEVLVTGTFNLLHPGHVELLEFASSLGRVTVGLNGDKYQKAKYGNLAIPLVRRAYVLQSCKYVSDVVFFNEDNPSELIRKLRPRLFVRGPDYYGVNLLEQAALDEVGARLVIHDIEKIYDSSILSTMLEEENLQND